MTLLALLLQAPVTDSIPASALDAFALTLPEGVIVALISAGTALGTWLLTRRAQVQDMAVRVEREAEQIAASRREHTEQTEAQRREAERQELVDSRKEELRILREVREVLRKELDELRDRVGLLEGELERARKEREDHSVERLQWIQEREDLRRQLSTAHEEIAELQRQMGQLENLLTREALQEYLAEHGPHARQRQEPKTEEVP